MRAFGRLHIHPPLSDKDDCSPRLINLLAECAAAYSENDLACTTEVEIIPDVSGLLPFLETGQDCFAFLSPEKSRELLDPVLFAGFSILPVNGPGFLQAALAACGFHNTSHVHLQEPPTSKQRLQAELKRLATEPGTLVFSLNEKNLLPFLELTNQILDQRPAVFFSPGEITRGTLPEIKEALPGKSEGGTLLVAGVSSLDDAGTSNALEDSAGELVASGLKPGKVAAKLSKTYGISRDQAYDLVKSLSHSAPEQSKATPQKTTCPSLMFRVCGHENMRATHWKTIEFKKECELSRKETCLAGVGAEFLPLDLKKLKGRVVVRLECENEHDEFTAVLNPEFNEKDRIVFRKSARRTPETIGTHASKGAADLNRKLVALLEDPAQNMTVTIRSAC